MISSNCQVKSAVRGVSETIAEGRGQIAEVRAGAEGQCCHLCNLTSTLCNRGRKEVFRWLQEEISIGLNGSQAFSVGNDYSTRAGGLRRLFMPLFCAALPPAAFFRKNDLSHRNRLHRK